MEENIWLPLPDPAEQKTLANALFCLMPPETFTRHEENALQLRSGMKSVSRSLGRVWGGAKEARLDPRWTHMAASQELLEATGRRAIKSLHGRGSPPEELLLCVPGSRRSFLTPGTAQWDLLHAIAQHFAQRPEEGVDQHLERCHDMCAPRRPTGPLVAPPCQPPVSSAMLATPCLPASPRPPLPCFCCPQRRVDRARHVHAGNGPAAALVHDGGAHGRRGRPGRCAAGGGRPGRPGRLL